MLRIHVIILAHSNEFDNIAIKHTSLFNTNEQWKTSLKFDVSVARICYFFVCLFLIGQHIHNGKWNVKIRLLNYTEHDRTQVQIENKGKK